MIFLKTDETGKVIYTHHKPFDNQYGLNKTKEQLLEEGHLVEKLPAIKNKVGFDAILYYTNSEFREEFIKNIQPTSEIDVLKAENAELKIAMAELAEQQMLADAETKLAMAELAEAMMGGAK